MGVRRGVIYLSHNMAGYNIKGFLMKSIALAAALTLAATTAFAGSLSEPVVEAPVEEPASSSAGSSASSGNGIVVPVLILLAVGAAVAIADN